MSSGLIVPSGRCMFRLSLPLRFLVNKLAGIRVDLPVISSSISPTRAQTFLSIPARFGSRLISITRCLLDVASEDRRVRVKSRCKLSTIEIIESFLSQLVDCRFPPLVVRFIHLVVLGMFSVSPNKTKHPFFCTTLASFVCPAEKPKMLMHACPHACSC